ncbi:MAG: hypothetical protein AB7N91_29020 [Candidatus Tectimicrobiota bacterium]
MRRSILSGLLVVIAVMGLLLPLRAGEAYVMSKTLMHTPVTGRLTDGRTFQGQLTVQAFSVDAEGQVAATGILAGTATSAKGRATKVAPHPFTAPAALLDLRGACTTLVVDLAPIAVAPLAQDLTLVPVVLGPPDASTEARLLQSTLCTMAHLQEEPVAP